MVVDLEANREIQNYVWMITNLIVILFLGYVYMYISRFRRDEISPDVWEYKIDITR
jgi:hypothetical protein